MINLNTPRLDSGAPLTAADFAPRWRQRLGRVLRALLAFLASPSPWERKP